MFDKYKFFRYLAYVIEILILYVLQETPNLFSAIIGVRPVLVISAVVVIAMFESQYAGLAFGVFAGVLMDIGSGKLMGFNAILLGMICYFIGVMAVDFIKTNILTAFLCSALTIALLFTLQHLCLYVFYGYENPGYAYQYHYLPLMLYSIIPMPVFYFLNKALNLWIREKI